ncbi:MAG: right-handed parallel beta-helix repeat-containing protein [bacterium]
MTRALFVFGVAVAAAGVAVADTILVPEDYSSVLAALDAAAAGDTVLVGPGTWTEQDTRPTSAGTIPANGFIPPGVTLLGSGPDLTILEGPPSPNEARAVVLVVMGSGEPVTIRGLACRGGGYPYWGLYADANLDLTIRDCVFEDNACAIRAWSVDGAIADCVFRRQDSTQAPPGTDSNTVLLSFSARWTIKGCVFEENAGGTLIEAIGIGLLAEIQSCRFLNNDSTPLIFLRDQYVMTVEDCWFEGNHSPANVSGRAIYTSNTRGSIRRNTFVGNSADDPAAPLIVVTNSDNRVVHITDNTLYGNEVVSGRSGFGILTEVPAEFSRNIVVGSGGGAAVYVNPVTEQPYGGCNVFWDNPGGNFENYAPKPTDLQADPLFCNPDANDFHVAEQSPCAPGGIPSCGQIGAWPVGCGLVSIEAASWGRIKSLYRGGE